MNRSKGGRERFEGTLGIVGANDSESYSHRDLRQPRSSIVEHRRPGDPLACLEQEAEAIGQVHRIGVAVGKESHYLGPPVVFRDPSAKEGVALQLPGKLTPAPVNNRGLIADKPDIFGKGKTSLPRDLLQSVGLQVERPIYVVQGFYGLRGC